LAPLLERLAARHGELGGPDLVRLSGFLAATHGLIERVANGGESFPALAELCRGVPRLGELQARLRRTFDRRGRIRDDATPTHAAGHIDHAWVTNDLTCAVVATRVDTDADGSDHQPVWLRVDI